MVRGPDFCREMRRGEEAAVSDLLRAAFGGEDEVRLVETLRKKQQIAGEMVLPWQDFGIAGYYALSGFVQPKGWLCLAPVAIHPELQGQGNGKRMLGLLTEWARISCRYIVVLGEPDFYSKCGFNLAQAAQLTSPYPITHTLLAGPGSDVPKETLIYPKAFESL
ncbi:GNAT family N-acetyltransferase [uncultured Roseovarius sp.]|uniref:GNAT family N-acetyltransferase n=1 Tax=uncultured Roseovarius sp. TaxID=293344 RepID=UPI00262A51FC|nr:N-acetyltransferase [uncultured Roseovarius sp.]